MEQLPFCDIFDESDEILRHTYQLIYAVGSHEQLPGAQCRWTVAEALLKQLQTNPVVKKVLQRPNVVVGSPHHGRS